MIFFRHILLLYSRSFYFKREFISIYSQTISNIFIVILNILILIIIISYINHQVCQSDYFSEILKDAKSQSEK